MDSNFPMPVVRSELHEGLALALWSSRLHRRLHDPNHVLADAAAEDMLENLAAAGFLVTATGLVLGRPHTPADHADEPRP